MQSPALDVDHIPAEHLVGGDVFLHKTIIALASLMLTTPAGAKLPVVGQMAPDFTLTLIDGTKIAARDLRGQVVVLSYWATWCVPCRTELPLLDSYYALQKKHGLRVFAATTESSLPLHRLKPLFAAMQIPAVRRMTGPYADVAAVPTNYIIDRSGRIRYAKAAALTLDDLNREIVPLLKEPAPEVDNGSSIGR